MSQKFGITRSESGDYFVVPEELMDEFDELELAIGDNPTPEQERKFARCEYVGGYASCILFTEWERR